MGSDAVNRDRVFSNYKSIFSRQFAVSLVVEFIGNMFFQILGATTISSKVDPTMPALVNGFALAVWIYTAANISGGHLNPAVSLSVFLCGFYPLTHTILYIILQIVGSIFGSMITAGLVPGAFISMGDGGPGCFDQTSAVSPHITMWQLFGWEFVMTFTLISVVYSCGVAEPGHGSHTPLAVGLALLCCAGSGGQYTGAALNPARVLGPLVVFGCGQNVAWIYILGQLTAALAACSVFAFVSGFGPMSFFSAQLPQLTFQERLRMCLTGAPPARFRESDRDNIFDFFRLLKSERSGVDAKMQDGTAQ